MNSSKKGKVAILQAVAAMSGPSNHGGEIVLEAEPDYLLDFEPVTMPESKSHRMQSRKGRNRNRYWEPS